MLLDVDNIIRKHQFIPQAQESFNTLALTRLSPKSSPIFHGYKYCMVIK